MEKHPIEKMFFSIIKDGYMVEFGQITSVVNQHWMIARFNNVVDGSYSFSRYYPVEHASNWILFNDEESIVNYKKRYLPKYEDNYECDLSDIKRIIESKFPMQEMIDNVPESERS